MINAKAMTEQASSGQIGHPAACMIDSKGCPEEARPGRSAAHYGRWAGCRARRGDAAAQQRRPVHRICGQLCGQPLAATRKPAPLWAPSWIAQILSRINCLKINNLQKFDRSMTRPTPRLACIGAPVEFRSRANAGFAGD
ncbi:MAG: hypothetical protein WAQ05_02985 [Rubrivivax sp.]